MYLDSDAAFFFKLSLHLSLDVFSYLLIFNRSLLFGCLSLQLIFLLSRCLRIFVSVWSWASYHILLLLKSFVVEEGGLIVSYSNCDSKVVRNEVEIGLTERWLINAANFFPSGPTNTIVATEDDCSCHLTEFPLIFSASL